MSNEIKKLSEKQKQLVKTFANGKYDVRVHYGPMGCGKSFAEAYALGYKCMTTKPLNTDGVIILCGVTAKTVKTNICGALTKLFGNENFRYSSSEKDGYTKDAILFGHKIVIIGLKDKGCEKRVAGANAYFIIVDELTFIDAATYDLLHARLRAELPDGWHYGIECATNPDNENHWVKVNIDNQLITGIHWNPEDRPGNDSKEYYDRLRRKWRDRPALLKRYVYGYWCNASEKLVYSCFKYDFHVYNKKELLNIVGRFSYYKIGVDWGTTNPTAILRIGVTSNNEHVVLDEEYIRDGLISNVADKIIYICNTCKGPVKGIYIDPSAKALRLQLESMGVYPEKANNDVDAGIDRVNDMLSDDKLFICDNCKNCLDEIQTYSYSLKDGQKVEKVNDHCMDALRYACYTDYSEGNA